MLLAFSMSLPARAADVASAANAEPLPAVQSPAPQSPLPGQAEAQKVVNSDWFKAYVAVMTELGRSLNQEGDVDTKLAKLCWSKTRF
jgi:hypothetical protein